MKAKPILLLFMLLIFLSCGESEKDKASRNDISVTCRQINAVFQDVFDSRIRENQLNLLMVRDFYSKYAEQFQEIRQSLAKQELSDDFKFLRSKLDTVITQGIGYCSYRQKIIVFSIELSNSASNTLDYIKEAYEYKYKDYGDKYFQRYMENAIEEAEKANSVQSELNSTVLKYKEHINNMAITSKRINSFLLDMNFTDTLSYHSSLPDTSDTILDVHKDLKDFDFDPEKLSNYMK